jgi:hypothetical protein
MRRMAEPWGRWVALLLAWGCAGCAARAPSPPSTKSPEAGDRPKPMAAAAPIQSAPETKTQGLPASSPFRFVDVARQAGIRFVHHSPLTEQRHLHSVYGSGVS